MPIETLLNNTYSILTVLAGGKSSRMGTPKGLLKFDNIFWVEAQFARAIEADFKKIILVLGYDASQYLEEIPFLKLSINKYLHYKGIEIKTLINTKPENGTFSSIQTALKSIVENVGIFVLPIDVPLLSLTDVEKMRVSSALVTIPIHRNKKGHPVKLAYDFWKTLLLIDDTDNYARLDYQIKTISQEHIVLIEVNNIEAILNLNTSEAWNDFLKLNK